MTTGFHGLHVTIGTIFLLFCLFRTLVTNLYYTELYIYLSNYFKMYLLYLTSKGVYTNNAQISLFDFSITLPTAIASSSPLGQNIDKIHERIKDMGLEIREEFSEEQLSVVPYNFEKNQHLGFETGA